jgi:hypothetical protein
VLAVAAVILVFSSIGIYFFSTKTASPQLMVKKVGEKSLPKNDIAPGSNKAVLHLADGTMIELDQAKVGLLANQGQTGITKTKDGQLIYENTGTTTPMKDPVYINFSTEHDNGSNGVKNMIDGTDGTRWHGRVGGAGYPHWLTIDMGIERTITEFGVWRTTFENGGDVRGPNRIRFEVSTDNITWTSLGTYDFNRLINGEQSYKLPAPHQKARYFKLVAVSGPEHYTVLGEVSAYGF